MERVLRVLEYPKVKAQLSQFASSSLGKEKVEQLQPIFNYEQVIHAQAATQEAMTVLRLKGQAPLGGIRDIRPALKRARIGGMLSAEELLDIASTIYGGRRLKQFLESLSAETSLPILEELAQAISLLKTVEQEIRACIDDHGEIMDSASSALRTVRQQIRSFETAIRQKLDQLSRNSAVQKMLQEAIVTIRNDRFCLPVKAEYRSQFGGIVHDQSASGATLFMEPEAIVQINNQLREARLKEQQEIEKILRNLSALIAEVVDPLEANVLALAELDLLFAKAYYAASIRAVQPKLNNRSYFRLLKARHPLIAAEEIVPISFELGAEYSALIITGPNTGGKTVTLKTLGLLTLMACSGLAVPAEEGSEIAVVSAVFADIGDEQSIEQSLSTFSSHMSNIVRILAEMDSQSLVLFDELGAGTDPTEGAALAMAILDHVRQCGARVVATTHYSELKAYAYNQEQVMNASVEFDVETLRPTYRLLVGVPGRSNAFSIARRLGLSSEIIEQAKGQISEEESRVESMIASLEENQKTAEQERYEAEKLRQEIETLKRSLERQQADLEQEKAQRIQEAEAKAQETIAKVMQEAEQVLTELRQLAKEKQEVKEHILIAGKKKLEDLQAGVASTKTKPAKQALGKSNVKLQPGDEVYVQTFGQKGQILEKVTEQEFLVQIGIMKMKVDRHSLEKISSQPPQTVMKARLQTSSEPAKLELDLRGETIDDAIMEIDKYLDEAILSGYSQVFIIHGKGTGQLRKGVQEYLKKHRQVKQIRLGGVGEGGSGVTVVQLK